MDTLSGTNEITWALQSERGTVRYYKRRGRGDSSVRGTLPSVVGLEETEMGPQTKECGGLQNLGLALSRQPSRKHGLSVLHTQGTKFCQQPE